MTVQDLTFAEKRKLAKELLSLGFKKVNGFYRSERTRTSISFNRLEFVEIRYSSDEGIHIYTSQGMTSLYSKYTVIM
jgi:hypothetical protein